MVERECDECGEVFNIDDLILVGNERLYYCMECYIDIGFDTCYHCGIRSRSDGMAYITYLDRNVCGDCFMVRYGYCRDCGEAFLYADLHAHPFVDAYQCRGCSVQSSVQIRNDPRYRLLQEITSQPRSGSIFKERSEICSMIDDVDGEI